MAERSSRDFTSPSRGDDAGVRARRLLVVAAGVIVLAGLGVWILRSRQPSSDPAPVPSAGTLPPETKATARTLADVYLRTGRLTEAEELLRQLVADDPADV
jgi:Tfp pilus assembly protein FimV